MDSVESTTIVCKKMACKTVHKRHGETPLETAMIYREGDPSTGRWRRRLPYLPAGHVLNEARFTASFPFTEGLPIVSFLFVFFLNQKEKYFHEFSPGGTTTLLYKYHVHPSHDMQRRLTQLASRAGRPSSELQFIRAC